MSFLLSLVLSLSSANAMPDGSYSTLKAQVEDESFASDQLAVLRLAASNNTFSPRQVAGLLDEMSFASDQIDALRILAPRLEAGDTSPIIGVFTFSSDQEEAQTVLAGSARLAPTPATAPPARTAGRPAPVPARTGGLNKNDNGAGMAPTSSPVRNNLCGRDPSLPALDVNWSSTWTDAEIDGLVAELEGISFSNDRMARLQARVQGRPEGLTGPQTVRLLGTFDFSSDLEAVITALDDNLLGLTVAEVRGILDAYTFSDGKLAALRVLSDAITDVEHASQLLDAFTFSSDKQAATAILSDLKPRSLLFGSVPAARVVFVVDTSGSMEASFRTNQGKSLTRLDFVRCELDSVLSEQLSPRSSFSIVTFSSGVQSWRDPLAVFSVANQTEAQSWVQGWQPNGATNIEGALREAMSLNPDHIYFLTDGAPTAGRMRKASDLVGLAQTGGTPIHTIAFLTGSHSSDNKSASRELMRAIADGTGGVYRAIE